MGTKVVAVIWRAAQSAYRVQGMSEESAHSSTFPTLCVPWAIDAKYRVLSPAYAQPRLLNHSANPNALK